VKIFDGAEHRAKVERLKQLDFYELAAHCDAILEAHGALPRWQTPLAQQVRARRLAAAA
jgi:hypothetical protein